MNKKLWFNKIDRTDIDFTYKLILISVIYFLINIFFLGIILYFWHLYFIIYILILIITQPIILGISNIILFPVDYFVRKIIVNRAKKQIKNFPKLIKIGITGSYGKTSQKEILDKILSSKYKVLSTVGNENTPIGISRLILNKLDTSHDILIVEMGAYHAGDIKELCETINPEINILTGITKQHLERFGSLDNIISTKFEIFENMKKGGIGYYDLNSKEILLGIDKFQNELKSITLEGINGNINFKYKANFQGIHFEYDNQNFDTKLLAPHNILQIITAYEIGKKLGINKDEILKSIKGIDHLAHRLELIYNPSNGVYVLDDSYNGNIKGIESIIKMFQKIDYEGIKIYLTPGIVELGEENEKIHFELGQKLGQTFNKYLLIDNSSTRALSKGLLSTGINKDSIIFYPSTLKAHNELKNILKKGDIIIFQNDWTENYFF